MSLLQTWCLSRIILSQILDLNLEGRKRTDGAACWPITRRWSNPKQQQIRSNSLQDTWLVLHTIYIEKMVFLWQTITGHQRKKVPNSSSCPWSRQVEWSDGSAVLAVQMLEVPSQVGGGQWWVMIQVVMDQMRVTWPISHQKLTWQWNIHHLKMYVLLNMAIFRCHDSFRECNCLLRSATK